MATFEEALEMWGGIIADAETRYGLPTNLLYAVGSRETDLQNELGDGGHGHGIWQLDDRSHTIPPGFMGDIRAQAESAASILATNIRILGLKAGISAYNAGIGGARRGLAEGDSDRYTTGRNYAADVLHRLASYNQLVGTTKGGGMAVSQNGYPANDVSLTDVYYPVGKASPFRIRKGPVATVLCYVIAQFDARVEKVVGPVLDDWGYAERPIRGGTELSNHASGTAVDINADKHPLGTPASASFTPAQINTIHQILNECSGVIRWGGDYTGRTDPMHFEANAPEAQVAAAATKLVKKDDMANYDEARLVKLVRDQIDASNKFWNIRALGAVLFGNNKAYGPTDLGDLNHLLGAKLDNIVGRLEAIEAKVNKP